MRATAPEKRPNEHFSIPQLLSAFLVERVELGFAACFGDFPLRSIQPRSSACVGRVQGTLRNLEKSVKLLHALRDSVAVDGSMVHDFSNQQIERAFEEIVFCGRLLERRLTYLDVLHMQICLSSPKVQKKGTFPGDKEMFWEVPNDWSARCIRKETERNWRKQRFLVLTGFGAHGIFFSQGLYGT